MRVNGKDCFERFKEKLPFSSETVPLSLLFIVMLALLMGSLVMLSVIVPVSFVSCAVALMNMVRASNRILKYFICKMFER